MPCVQDELAPPGAGPTEPEEGFGPVDGTEARPVSEIAKSRAKPLMMTRMLRAARADVKLEDFLFIWTLR
jgi:hypothetical protein